MKLNLIIIKSIFYLFFWYFFLIVSCSYCCTYKILLNINLYSVAFNLHLLQPRLAALSDTHACRRYAEPFGDQFLKCLIGAAGFGKRSNAGKESSGAVERCHAPDSSLADFGVSRTARIMPLSQRRGTSESDGSRLKNCLEPRRPAPTNRSGRHRG